MKKILILVAICLLESACLYADTGLSLEQCLRLAYVHHPEMNQAHEEVKASSGRRFEAEMLPDPEFGLEIGGLKDNNGSRRGDISSFSVKQPLDPLGTRYLAGQIAKDEMMIAESDVDLTWAKVREEVVNLYASILSNEKSLEIARDNLDLTRNFFVTVDTQYQSAKALKSDAIRAKIEVSQAENEFLILEKDLKILIGQMNLALGQPLKNQLDLEEQLSHESLNLKYEILKESALFERADLKQEEKRFSVNKKTVWQSILKTIFPKMAIGFTRTTEDYENDTSITLEASYPLWGFNQGAIKEAKANRDKQEIILNALKDRIGLEVYKAYLEADVADKQVELQLKSLEESDELLRQTSTQYQEGEISFLQYLENVKTIKKTKLAYLEALKNYKIQIAALDRVVQNTPMPELTSADKEIL